MTDFAFTHYQQHIADYLAQQLPALKSVQTHGGSITEAELRRWGAQAPAVFVSVLGCRQPQTTLTPNLDLVFCLYVVTRDTRHGKRGDLALNLVQGLNQLLVGQRWQTPGFVTLPSQIDSQNLFNTELDKTGLNLWAITFNQTVELGSPPSLEELNDYITHCQTWQLGTNEASPQAQDHLTLATQEPTP